jgi:leader peptidase (prepilin peptidase) / N-methyltransferase
MLLSGWMILLVAPFIGSWLGVLVRRWPQGEPVALARSACPHCQHVLAPLDMVPLLSFAWLKGRCRYCSAPIGWFHPAIELAALAVAAAVVCADGGGWPAWADAALGWALLTAAWIDAENFRLPDLITLPLILAGLLVTWATQSEALFNHAAAAAAGYIAFRAINAAYARLRHQQGLGEGDAKLLAAAGAWLGLAALPYVVFGAALAGIAMVLLTSRGRLHATQRIPFGPALALSFFLLRLWGS